MPRKRKPGRPKTRRSAAKGKRGRKPIFTAGQKRVLNRLIGVALKGELRKLARAL